ncbi:hypothetical protein HPB52_017351 [Rhipicephalus sanguineus]|uniref:Uncharacterized protein n=1 Tax=Rhipicephalus sanguineus TaxID=34632 RepID=A0A9D4Q1G8_RHISA|nr:hypothetical protein HPB52_017351 [Rhipicephalus sanguineus]
MNNQDVRSEDARANSDNESGVTGETVREAHFPVGAGQSDGVTVRELLNALMEKDRVLTALLERLAPSATPQPVSAGTPGGIAALAVKIDAEKSSDRLVRAFAKATGTAKKAMHGEKLTSSVSRSGISMEPGILREFQQIKTDSF